MNPKTNTHAASVHPLNAALCKLGLHLYGLGKVTPNGTQTLALHFNCAHCPKLKLRQVWQVQYDAGVPAVRKTAKSLSDVHVRPRLHAPA